MRRIRHTRRRRVAKLRSASSGSGGWLLACSVVAATLACWASVHADALEVSDVLQRTAAAAVEAMPLSVDLQMETFFTVLPYDRNLNKRGWSAIHIGIVFVGSDPASSKVRTDIVDYLKRISGTQLGKGKLPIMYTAVEYTSDAQIEGAVKAGQFNVLYIAPGNARNLSTLVQVSHGQRIITVTGVQEYVQRGVAVGIGVRQDKLDILINLPSSRSAGIEFDASLLNLRALVRVIK